jgi:hypothetical protein
LRRRAGLITVLVAGAMLVMPYPVEARPRPGVRPGGFRLHARAVGALTINRVYCGLHASGAICVDSTGSGFAGGGFWPKGTADQYVFSSGFQVAGIIDPNAGFGWAGDTVSATLYNPAGGTDGEPVRPIHNTTDPVDLANWPAAGLVPKGDASADLFSPILQGRPGASQGDVWWLSWDGNPTFNSGTAREHPLGVLVEHRGMGWNFPAGNEDILYFIYTVYNITSTRAADYAAVRPAMRELLLEKAADFERLNEAQYGIAIPPGGYSIQQAYVAFAADMDVGNAGLNYASVNLPFALGYAYDHSFGQSDDWTFDPGIFGPPFFAGTGFVGVKYLQSPVDDAGNEVGLTLFGNTINQGSFNDPGIAQRLYRYLSGTLSSALGDAQCNMGNPRVTRICFLNNAEPDDMRFFQSSGPMTLDPGEFGSIVVAYIFAPPVADPACSPPCDIRPEDPTILGDRVRMEAGVNPIDRLTGYSGFTDANGDGKVEQAEFRVIPGSLLGKARVAQEVFNSRFLLPFAPDPPSFFLIPGNGQVTVLWQPSASESTGDAFFAIANPATIAPPGGGAPVPNPLYDPNYRQNDVEGYRVYRGRVDSPNSLQLMAQFDYAGTLISDYQGQINPSPTCAPEVGIDAGADPETGVDLCDFDPIVPGVARAKHVDVPLLGPVVQVELGRRAALADGRAILLEADTAVIGAASGCLGSGNDPECPLRDTGVPFVYLDRTSRNNLRYFYSVTAFDLNSIQSGPSSLESPRTTKAVTPAVPASNYQSSATTLVTMLGREVPLAQNAPLPAIDPTTGRFSERFPPADNVRIAFVGQQATEIFAGGGSFSVRLTGLGLGDSRNGVPAIYTYTATASTGEHTTLNIPVVPALGSTNTVVRGPPFPAALADPALAAQFGVPAGFTQTGEVNHGLTGYTATNAFGRGAVDSSITTATGTTGVHYNGPRWFQGSNETKDHPNAGNVAGTENATDFNNAGELPGVVTIQNPQSYAQLSGDWRRVEAVLTGAVRAADFNFYWGAGGQIDSVIDLTHNVPVPFMAESLGAGWGFLNQAATTAPGAFDQRPDVLTVTDFGCVHPLREPSRAPDTQGPDGIPCTATPYPMSDVAIPGPVAIFGGVLANAGTQATASGPGFAVYVAGHIFMMELAPGGGVPALGTVWTLRSYIGHVSGGNGAAGVEGPYAFTPASRTFSALGAELRLSYDVVNQVRAASKDDLSRVHTVPDPYYVTSAFDRSAQGKTIQFVNLPQDAIIRIYSSSGVLVTLLEHHSETFGGAATWNVLSRNNLVVASGVYFYHIESGGARRVGRMTVVNFAE